MDWTSYVIVWIVSAVICLALARRKGNPPEGAFVAGLLLGPIGVILTLLQRDVT